MNKLHFGMIGAGSISRSHPSVLAARADVEITGIADMNEAAAREQAARFGVRGVFTDYGELVARADVDAVVVGIPTHFHAEAAVAALRAGSTCCARSRWRGRGRSARRSRRPAPKAPGCVRRYPRSKNRACT